ncbi:MAG: 2-oxoglutarate dehydrogenase complex dihydrolipoyllysine-residue succinyltransferase [Bdellovibrionales bacterium]|nr:2-oxoglutarate dehydrogenase complex dihydrolipoyllysine-residue succinyltransferase [Oligoflexia bacterium]
MKHDILAPMVGESITEVSILKWTKPNGSQVKAGEMLLEIESDKATVEIVAEQSGLLNIVKNDGERVDVKSIIGSIDDAAQGTVAAADAKAPPPPPSTAQAASAAPPPPPGANAPQASSPPPPSAPSPAQLDGLSPAVRKAVVENNVNPAQVSGTGKDGRVTKGDVMSFIASGAAQSAPTQAALPKVSDKPGDRRVPMPMIRKRIAERLVFAQHTAAILTTFNEVDMKPVQEIRAEHKEAFEKKYGQKLSFMSFFTRACTLALKQNPGVNAFIDGNDFVFHDYVDIGVAVGTERGLVVPVIRGADKMTFAEIEKAIGEVALKARNGKLSIADMSGGTFTISNGGTYGSLLSTPILNPPQSGILGMHKIMDRPIAINGKVEIRPMMYLALSYDHRVIDGKEAVTFLVHVKDLLENPAKLGLEFI